MKSSRVLYVKSLDKRVIVMRAFVKKTQKTAGREIGLALRCAKDIL